MARSLQITFEKRLMLIFFSFVFAFGLATIRLGQLQILEAEEHRSAVRERRLVSRLLPAPRGRILDRNGRVLAESVETWDLRVYPVTFREQNRVDALGDLAMALMPDRVSGLLPAPTQLKAEFVESRFRRFLSIYLRREQLTAALLTLPTSRCDLSSGELFDRWEAVLYPRAELVVPPDARLRHRFLDAILIVADDPALSTRSRLLERLDSEPTLGAALGIDVRSVVRGIEDEMAELGWLADELGEKSRDAFLHSLFEKEFLARERLEQNIIRSLDNRIALQRFGVHDLSKLNEDDLEALAEELRVPLDNAEELWIRLTDLRKEALGAAVTDPKAQGLLREFEGVEDFEEFEDLAPARRRVLAYNLGLWSRRPDRLERELGRQTREKPDYRERDYLSSSRKWVRIQHYKGGIPYRLGSGLRFEVADRIWRTFGLRRAGFDIRASYGRRNPEDESGTTTMLLGKVTAAGSPLGGVELALSSQGDPENPEGARIDGKIVGEAGVVKRERQTDGSFLELETSRRPVPGEDVVLSIDLEFQNEVAKILEEMNDKVDGRMGAGAVVIDLQTGDILCAVSVPRVNADRYLRDYDEQVELDEARRAINRNLDLVPADIDDRRSRLQWRLEDLGFWNRAFEADAYWSPLGSVMKVFSAAALLHHDAMDPDAVMQTWDRGPVDLDEALYRSSNVYFRELVKKIGQKKLLAYLRRFGMFEPIDYAVSPSSARRRWKRVQKFDAANNTVIGQGSVSFSPLEVAAMMARFAGRGQSFEPRLVLSQGETVTPRRLRGEVFVPQENWDRIVHGMARVADHYSTLAIPYGVVGKTGTADGFPGRWKKFHQAWFSGFAPKDNPRIAFAVTSVRTEKIGKHVTPYAVRIAKLALERMP